MTHGIEVRFDFWFILWWPPAAAECLQPACILHALIIINVWNWTQNITRLASVSMLPVFTMTSFFWHKPYFLVQAKTRQLIWIKLAAPYREHADFLSPARRRAAARGFVMKISTAPKINCWLFLRSRQGRVGQWRVLASCCARCAAVRHNLREVTQLRAFCRRGAPRTTCDSAGDPGPRVLAAA